MNYSATFGILVVVLLAYCNSVPPQRLTFDVDEAVFENGQRCFTDANTRRYTRLTKYSITNDGYVIQEKDPINMITDKEFDLRDLHTMICTTAVLSTNVGSLRLQFPNVDEAHQLFNLAAAITLRTNTYSYRLKVVYKYGGDSGVPIHGISISGYTPKGKASSERYIIHTGSTEHSGPIIAFPLIQPFLLWTAGRFNYCDYDKRSIVVTLPNPVEGANSYNYYLVVFIDRSELARWKNTYGKKKYCSSRIPKADANPEIFSHFATKYVRNDDSDEE